MLGDSSCDGSTKSVATCGASHTDNWQWSSEALRCGAQRLGAPELRPAFKGRWLLIAGDSIARYFYAALLRVLSADSASHSELPILHIVSLFC